MDTQSSGHTGLDRWYAYAKSQDSEALWEILHPDAVFTSPVRPLKAVNMLHQMMGAQLEAMSLAKA